MTEQTIQFVPPIKIRQSNLYELAQQICAILQQNGYSAYFVGGAVRDFFIFALKLPKDIDICTSATPTQIKQIFPSTGVVGKQFGVSFVWYKEHNFELATFRSESDYQDFRHPNIVNFGTIQQDYLRRDFTINALYFDPQKNTIIDYASGLTDIQHKKLNCVGNPAHRFTEDPLRILRLCRFCHNLNFKPSQNTLQAAKITAVYIQHLSKERILLEIEKLTLNAFNRHSKFCYYFIYIIRSQYLFNLKTELILRHFKLNSDNFHQKFPVTTIAFFFLNTQNSLSDKNLILNELLKWPGKKEDIGLLKTIQEFIIYAINHSTSNKGEVLNQKYKDNKLININELPILFPIKISLIKIMARYNLTLNEIYDIINCLPKVSSILNEKEFNLFKKYVQKISIYSPSTLHLNHEKLLLKFNKNNSQYSRQNYFKSLQENQTPLALCNDLILVKEWQVILDYLKTKVTNIIDISSKT